MGKEDPTFSSQELISKKLSVYLAMSLVFLLSTRHFVRYQSCLPSSWYLDRLSTLAWRLFGLDRYIWDVSDSSKVGVWLTKTLFTVTRDQAFTYSTHPSVSTMDALQRVFIGVRKEQGLDNLDDFWKAVGKSEHSLAFHISLTHISISWLFYSFSLLSLFSFSISYYMSISTTFVFRSSSIITHENGICPFCSAIYRFSTSCKTTHCSFK